MVFTILTSTFVILGGITFLMGAIGVHRAPDVYCRASTMATATGLGLAFFTLALVFDDFTLINCIKALVAFTIHLFTSSVSGQLIARSAYASDVKLSDKTHKDELLEFHT